MLPDDRSAGFSGPLFNYVKACVAPCPQMTHIWVQTPNPIICAIWPEVIIVERSGGMAMLLLSTAAAGQTANLAVLWRRENGAMSMFWDQVSCAAVLAVNHFMNTY